MKAIKGFTIGAIAGSLIWTALGFAAIAAKPAIVTVLALL